MAEVKSFKKRKYNEDESKKSEEIFFDFCKKNNITCRKLDGAEGDKLREKYLKNPNGNCPDFIITKNGKKCFVEVKTLVNLTNAKREKEIDKRRDFLHRNHQSGILFSDVIDVTSELWTPFRTFLQSSSNKFKNIKATYSYPRLLLMRGFSVDMYSVQAVFDGSYHTYLNENNELRYVGFRKKREGLFDKTGSNVSAVIYWNRDQDRYFGLENHKALIKFSEKLFKLFFF